MAWVDDVLNQAKEKPGPRLQWHNIELREFVSHLKEICYNVTLYSSESLCQFKLSMCGTVKLPKDTSTFTHKGVNCLWLYDNDEKWFSIPIDTIGTVYDQDQNTWTFSTGSATVKLIKKGGDK